MGIAAVLRATLVRGREFAARRRQNPDQAADLRMDVIADALEGKLPVIVRAHRRDDILTALRFSDEFGFNLVLLGASDAYLVADILAEKKVPVILGPIDQQPDSMETLGANYQTAARLHEAGVKFAFQSNETTLARQMVANLGLAVAYGLPEEEALKALTLYPAQIFGVEDRLGSLEPGKEATFFLSRGDPLQVLSPIVEVFVRGKRYEPRTYQTELCEHYIHSKMSSIPCLPKR
jgi:imidazolonepropionase-like amidohydrolase